MSQLTDNTWLTDIFYLSDTVSDPLPNPGDNTMTVGFILSGAAAPANVLAIPVADIDGLVLGDLVADANADTKTLFSKVGASLLADLFDYFSANPVLGLTQSRSMSTPSYNVLTRSLSFSLTLYWDSVTNLVKPLPVATTGTNSGVGKVALQDIFTGATYIASGSNAASNVVYVTEAAIEAFYSGANLATANLASGQDNRDIIFGLIGALLTDTGNLRSATVKSAFTAMAIGNTTVPSLPTNATATTNPTTGLPTNLAPVYQFAKAITASYQEKVNEDTRVTSVYVADSAGNQ